MRTCTDPPARYGGRECAGERFQTNSCFLQQCETATSTEPSGYLAAVEEGETKQSDEEEERTEEQERAVAACASPPEVLHFLSPVVEGGRAVYQCSRGRVLDLATNRRSLALTCNPSTGRYSLPDSWPVCRPPTHCVGPANTSLALHPPHPRRHAPVNTAVRYRCRADPARTLRAGCFSDGRYRYPAGWPACPGANPHSSLCQSAPSNVVIAVPGLAVGQHGWIHSPGYPALTTLNSSCSWAVRAPPGYLLTLGLESLQVRAVGAGEVGLELVEPGRPDRGLGPPNTGHTFTTRDNSLTVRSNPGQQQAWRLSYLVVEPT